MPVCDNSHLRGTQDRDPVIKYNVNNARTGGRSGWVRDGRYAGIIEAGEFVQTKNKETHNARLSLRTTAQEEQAGTSINGDFVIEGQNFIDSIMRSIHSAIGNLDKVKAAGDADMRLSKIAGRAVFFDTKTEVDDSGEKQSRIAGWVSKEEFEAHPGPFKHARGDDLGGAKSESRSNGSAAAASASEPKKTADEFDMLR